MRIKFGVTQEFFAGFMDACGDNDVAIPLLALHCDMVLEKTSVYMYHSVLGLVAMKPWKCSVDG